MNIVYAREPFPTEGSASIFLAGPTPRANFASVPSWRPEALRILRDLGFKGHVYVPEDRNGKWSSSEYANQVEWEEKALNRSDVIVFWIPRDMASLPGLTTNDEWGVWKDSGKVVLGTPEGAQAVKYQRYYAAKYKVPVSQSLDETLTSALVKLQSFGGPTTRTDGLLSVPLHIYRNAQFQHWLKHQTLAGNRVADSAVRFSTWVGPNKSTLMFWCLWAKVWIGSEGRYKENEILFSRPDISSIVLHGPIHRGDLGSTEIVLVREFRVPANNPTGFVWENPGGSSHKPGKPPQQTASEEVSEETGITLDPNRFQAHGVRQLMSTMSLHRSHLFGIEVTGKEMVWLKSQAGKPKGVLEDTERTYVEVRTLRELLAGDYVDWSTLGMIFSVLCADSDFLG